jgi:hypothetical protein
MVPPTPSEPVGDEHEGPAGRARQLRSRCRQHQADVLGLEASFRCARAAPPPARAVAVDLHPIPFMSNTRRRKLSLGLPKPAAKVEPSDQNEGDSRKKPDNVHDAGRPGRLSDLDVKTDTEAEHRSSGDMVGARGRRHLW